MTEAEISIIGKNTMRKKNNKKKKRKSTKKVTIMVFGYNVRSFYKYQGLF